MPIKTDKKESEIIKNNNIDYTKNNKNNGVDRMKTNNSMIEAVENSKVSEVYEVIKEAEPLPKLVGEAEYNYDNVVDELVDIKEVVALNLFKTITNMNKKIINGRIKDKEAEKIRLDYIKAYINACNCFNTMMKNGAIENKYSKETLINFINLED